jgi:hypothetical protein
MGAIYSSETAVAASDAIRFLILLPKATSLMGRVRDNVLVRASLSLAHSLLIASRNYLRLLSIFIIIRPSIGRPYILKSVTVVTEIWCCHVCPAAPIILAERPGTEGLGSAIGDKPVF